MTVGNISFNRDVIVSLRGSCVYEQADLISEYLNPKLTTIYSNSSFNH